MFSIKRKYRPTILNLASGLLIGIDTYIYWSSYLRGEIYEYGTVALFLSFLMGGMGLVIDLVLQKSIKSYWLVNGIGLVLVILFMVILYL